MYGTNVLAHPYSQTLSRREGPFDFVPRLGEAGWFPKPWSSMPLASAEMRRGRACCKKGGATEAHF